MKKIVFFAFLFFCAPSFGRAEDLLKKKNEEATSILKVVWGERFVANFELAEKVKIIWVTRAQMTEMATLLGFPPETNGGRIAEDVPQDGLYIVYDDLPPFLIAKTFNHEIEGHARNSGLPPHEDEAAARKKDEPFLAALFGKEWLDATVAALLKKTKRLKKGGGEWNAITPQATGELFSRFKKGGLSLDKKNEFVRLTLERLVFDLTNSEEAIASWLEKKEKDGKTANRSSH